MRNGKIGAGNETRTRDPNLGKVVLYQLSYSRINQAAYFGDEGDLCQEKLYDFCGAKAARR